MSIQYRDSPPIESSSQSTCLARFDDWPFLGGLEIVGAGQRLCSTVEGSPMQTEYTLTEEHERNIPETRLNKMAAKHSMGNRILGHWKLEVTGPHVFIYFGYAYGL